MTMAAATTARSIRPATTVFVFVHATANTPGRHQRAIVDLALRLLCVLALDRFAADGLVRINDGRITVTEAGRPFVRNVAAVFDAYLDASSDKPKHAQAV